ncbi:MAG TPA: hypothetical protein VJR47_18885 [Stellaceae bacterium]|nr:hypothetical protein [Stellaceae bacterium]
MNAPFAPAQPYLRASRRTRRLREPKRRKPKRRRFLGVSLRRWAAIALGMTGWFIFLYAFH